MNSKFISNDYVDVSLNSSSPVANVTGLCCSLGCTSKPCNTTMVFRRNAPRYRVCSCHSGPCKGDFIKEKMSLDGYRSTTDLEHPEYQRDSHFNFRGDVEKTVPAPRLVGIEPNPGPPKNKVKETIALVKSVMEKVKHPKQQKQKSMIPSVRNTDAKFPSARFNSKLIKGMTIKQIEPMTLAINVNNSSGINNYLSMNPGDVLCFPWLSTIAQNFGKYRFKRLKVIYRPLVSAFNNAGNNAKIVVAFNYDVTDPVPTSVSAMEQFGTKFSNMLWQTGSVDIDINQLDHQDSYYIRGNIMPHSEDPKTYDIGQLNILTTTNTVNQSAVGEIFLDYEVELFNPINSQTNTLAYKNTIVNTWVSNSATSGFTSAGGRNIYSLANSDSISVVSVPEDSYFTLSNGGVWTCQQSGYYLITINVNFTSSTLTMFQGSVNMTKNGSPIQPVPSTQLQSSGGTTAFAALSITNTSVINFSLGDVATAFCIVQFTSGSVAYVSQISFLAV